MPGHNNRIPAKPGFARYGSYLVFIVHGLHFGAEKVKEQAHKCNGYERLKAGGNFGQAGGRVNIAVTNGGGCDDAEIDVINGPENSPVEHVETSIDDRKTEAYFHVIEKQHEHISPVRPGFHKHVGNKDE